jgi:Mn2+/Fe2+ NRAMP family transporter
MKGKNLLNIVGPGILVAATGVGAGDLATASLTGAHVGLMVLWAVLLGAFLKYVLNEGLTRWQLATGTTLLEGSVQHLGQWLRWLLLAYLIVWSFLLAAALMSAIGVTCHAMYPLAGEGIRAAQTDKIVYGIAHSVLAVLLVKLGGYRVFEKVMSVCIGVMFLVVVLTAVALRPDLSQFFRGLLVPVLPTQIAGGLGWTIALMGGVGGTVTLLCYGYWIREEGRENTDSLPLCRIDLATGYTMTAIFGLAMVVIGNSLEELSGGGANLMVNIADRLQVVLGSAGPLAKWAFLIGAWGAVFSSLFGVWQSIPYLFADLWSLSGTRPGGPSADRVNTSAWSYQAFLYAMATVPMIGLIAIDFETIQKTYALVGALFVPMLAAVLLALNRRPDWIGQRYTNSRMTTLVLLGTLAFFVFAGILEIFT